MSSSSHSLVRGILLAAALLIRLVAAQSVNASDTAQSPYPTGDDQIQLTASYAGASNNAPPRFNLVNLTAAAVTKLSVSI